MVLFTTKDFLARHGDCAADVERMHAAWTKAAMLHMTLWTRSYARGEDW